MVIDDAQLTGLLALEGPDGPEVGRILDKAMAAGGLGLEEAALLLRVDDPMLIERLSKAAGEVKEKVFGKRIVLFAPLYLSNYCTNGCVYCGFRSSNDEAARKALTVDEAVKEAAALEAMGFTRLLLVIGEDPRWGVDYVAGCIRAIYEKTGIRILHVNAPPTEVDELKKLKEAGAGVYQSFQETYHGETYARLHPWGRKKDYRYRLDVMDRAIEAGFEDVGIGALLGLYDYRFDCLAAISHSIYLYSRYGTHAHTVSVPRLRPAEGFSLDGAKVPHMVGDLEFKKVVAVYRLALPSVGVVVSTREPEALRDSLMRSGASQLSAASRTNPGGYAEKERSVEQFSTSDKRSLEEVMAAVMRQGGLPSLCTSCYRSGRVGHSFTETTLSGKMGGLCQANAVLTLKEYLCDHSRNGLREGFERLIAASVDGIEDEAVREAVRARLARIENGERDVFF